MQRHPFSQPAFFLFLLVNATLIIRPAEIFVELADVRIYEFLILGALALSYKEIQQHCRLQSLRQQPMTLCVFGVFVAVILSHLSHMYLYGVRTSGIEFLKTMVYYGLWVAVVDTPRRLRITLGFIAIMSTIMVGMCILDYYAFVDLEFITHSKDRNGFTPTGTLIWVIRMRGTGLFQDPNDISLLIVATGVICLYFLTDKSQKLWRLAWLFPLFVMGNGLICTRSRGGLLAAAGAMIGMLLMRFGRKTAIAIGVCGMLALPLIAGRQGSFNLSDGTGHDRILLWREGFQAIKSAYIVFGIGYGNYGDYAGLVAHNSFVHSFVELGFFGGTFFFGMFFFALYSFYKMASIPPDLRHPEITRMKPYIMGILAGWSTGLLTLSRCYVPPTFMVLGTVAAYLNYVNFTLRPHGMLVYFDRKHVTYMVNSSAALFVSIYAVILVLGR